jgi:cytochrome d ubiquinol oxidase subunit I
VSLDALPFALTDVDLARIQFGFTSLYHFLFVPLTLGLAPLVAVMQTLWHRSGDESWLRLTRFFGTLLLINFAIGVATGLVQEFQFGMNWSTYSAFVGNVFGTPLAIEGLAAFSIESVFLGLWVFGWDKLPPRAHLATIWVAAAGMWLSAYFILVANSWMQYPVGYELADGGAQAHLTNVWELLGSKFAAHALLHTLLAGLTTALVVVFGVACWHLLRGRNVELFKRAAAFALIALLPLSALNLAVGSRFGIITTDVQPMKIAAAEALWDSEKPAGFSLFQIGGFSREDPNPSFDIEVPALLSFLATGSFTAEVEGLNQIQAQYEQQYGPGDYIPPVRPAYWAMRAMAYFGTLVVLLAAVGAYLYRRKTLETTRWFLWSAVGAIALPYLAALSGWVLTEMGRQPWIVQGLLRTADAHSPSVGTSTIAVSLGVFALLYAALAVTDFVLMRRYATVDPPAVAVPH